MSARPPLSSVCTVSFNKRGQKFGLSVNTRSRETLAKSLDAYRRLLTAAAKTWIAMDVTRARNGGAAMDHLQRNPRALARYYARVGEWERAAG